MGQSLVKNYLHIVFSTKHRQPMIVPSIEEELYKYISGICRSLESPAIRVGGYLDHVHVLCSLSKNIALCGLLEELKGHSSKWIKTKGHSFSNFYWQNGYGAFSVNYRGVDAVAAYIENQHEHHMKKSFQTEYRALLNEYQVEYDERYIWL